MLSIGPFTFADTRYFPYTNARLNTFLMPDDAVFEYNWQMWRWDPATFQTVYEKASVGDPAFVQQVAADKAAASKIADDCLQKLDAARPQKTVSPMNRENCHQHVNCKQRGQYPNSDSCD